MDDRMFVLTWPELAPVEVGNFSELDDDQLYAFEFAPLDDDVNPEDPANYSLVIIQRASEVELVKDQLAHGEIALRGFPPMGS